jgi:hypothetical protein
LLCQCVAFGLEVVYDITRVGIELLEAVHIVKALADQRGPYSKSAGSRGGLTMTPELAQYKKITDEELTSALQAAIASREAATQFWRSVTDYPNSLLREGNVAQSQVLLLNLMNKCRSLVPEAYHKIHKGSPYYWLGIAAFLLRDYPTADFFMDATITEDLKWETDVEKSPTPAISFLMLESSQLNPNAQKLAQAAEAKLQLCLEFYKSLAGKPTWLPDLSLPRLRLKFLHPALSRNDPSWRRLAVSLISFMLEWDFRKDQLTLRAADGTFEPFYLHLLKGCILFEGLLNENPKKKPVGGDLGAVVDELHAELGINPPSNLSGRFNDILGDLAQADNRIETAVVFTLRLRRAVLQVSGEGKSVSLAQYQQLFEMTAAAGLYSLACLY